LYLLGQRWYEASVGRFISRDPLEELDGINLYIYTKNNPMNLKDPYGLACGPGKIGNFFVPDCFSSVSGESWCFTDACKHHDECYSTCGESKDECDYKFLAEMLLECSKLSSTEAIEACINMAKTYYGAVRTPFGKKAYKAAQKKCCKNS